MRILLCTARPPYPIIHGDNLLVHNLAKNLSVENSVYLFTLVNNELDQANLKTLFKMNLYKTIWVKNRPKASFLGKTIDHILLNPKLYIPLRYPGFSNNIINQLKKIVEIYKIDILQIHGIDMCLFLSKINNLPKIAVLADSMSFHLSRNINRSTSYHQLMLNNYFFLKVKKLEKYILNLYQHVIVVSSKDALFLKNLNQEANIEVIPNGVDADIFQSRSRIKKNISDEYNILFTGNMGYKPNEDAAFYIFKEIFPIIKSYIPNIRFYIVGANPSLKLKKLNNEPNVIVTGFVEDINEYLELADVALLPMRLGSGIKNKILEAMSMGKPVVTNSIGIEGFNEEVSKAVFVADKPQEIAYLTIDLLKDRSKRIKSGELARKVVIQYYSWKSCVQRYEEIYRKAISMK